MNPGTEQVMREAGIVPRRARDWKPFKYRECPRCFVWTECGACPDCGLRLGEPPYAKAIPPGSLLRAVPLPPPNWVAGVSRWPGRESFDEQQEGGDQ